MKELLDKLSSYNIFNYLLPGIIFVILSKAFTSYSFVQQDVILGVFLYYFIGLVISRIGSLLIEPLLKHLKFLQFADYSDFISASQEDKKLELLSEANNMYRTFCALFSLILLLKGYDKISTSFPIVGQWGGTMMIVGLFAMFIFSYRKQTKYITQRIAKMLKKG
jgi:hypothetical protein